MLQRVGLVVVGGGTVVADLSNPLVCRRKPLLASLGMMVEPDPKGDGGWRIVPINTDSTSGTKAIFAMIAGQKHCMSLCPTKCCIANLTT